MEQLGIEAANKSVANVSRSFFCAKRNAGVTPSKCQACWLQGKEAFNKSHAECIAAYRVIARPAFEKEPLTVLEKAIWNLLWVHARGMRNAMTSHEIRKRLSTEGFGSYHLSDDSLRKSIRDMLLEKDYYVASTNKLPLGYYVPLTDEENEANMFSLHSRETEIHRRKVACARHFYGSPEKLAKLGLPVELNIEGVR